MSWVLWSVFGFLAECLTVPSVYSLCLARNVRLLIVLAIVAGLPGKSGDELVLDSLAENRVPRKPMDA